tara:strand:- start:174 stop:626 length:453 start_codon:yes stop_codon:yes gene_type:complete
MDPICVFTDGACRNNGKKNAKAGIGIYFGENDDRNISERISGKQTNNCAELLAIIKVFDILTSEIKQGTPVSIYSDSKYSIDCLTKWSQLWAQNNWRKPIKNKELIKHGYDLFQLYNNVTIFHIKAHTTNMDILSVGNRKADYLANQSIL